jgi:hypothetical protein
LPGRLQSGQALKLLAIRKWRNALRLTAASISLLVSPSEERDQAQAKLVIVFLDKRSELGRRFWRGRSPLSHDAWVHCHLCTLAGEGFQAEGVPSLVQRYAALWNVSNLLRAELRGWEINSIARQLVVHPGTANLIVNTA